MEPNAMTYRGFCRFFYDIAHRIQILAMIVSASVTTLVFAFASVAPVSAAGAIRCVASAGGATAAPCANSAAYTTIQAAVAAASSGDEIRIANGTYTSTDQYVVSILDKSLTLRGGYSSANWQSPSLPGATIIDGQAARGGVLVFGSGTIVLERLTITHGHNGTGGGIEANLFGGVPLTLIDTVIANNTATGSGGGLFAVGGPAVAIRTQIINNTAGEDGGGFYGLNFTATDSSIIGNTTNRNGGGINVLYASIANARIENNTASNGNGGGMFFNPSSIGGTLAMTRTRMLDNHAGVRGGALFLGSVATAQLSWSLLANNQSGNGDALAVDSNSLAPSQIGLANVTVANGSLSPRAAIQLSSGPMNLNLTNTVVTSYTIGIQRPSNASLSGDYNAFFNNGADQLVSGSASPLPFVHLLTADPQFVEPGAANFHLRDTGPLRDAGDPLRSYTNQQDLDGVALPIGPVADIGAYEYILRSQRIYVPLCAR
jgi:hypothetical protein